MGGHPTRQSPSRMSEETSGGPMKPPGLQSRDSALCLPARGGCFPKPQHLDGERQGCGLSQTSPPGWVPVPMTTAARAHPACIPRPAADMLAVSEC